MTWKTLTVIEARCDTCGQKAIDDDNAFWYQDRQTAREALAGHGWTFTGPGGGTATCHDCVQMTAREVRRAACEIVGHTWGTWVDRVYSSWIGRTRTCPDCDTTEYDPPLPGTRKNAA